MILITLSQEMVEIPIAIFETEEDGREFLSLIPGYQHVEEVIEDFTYDYEMIDPKALPEYMEIEYKENRFPFTKFSFSLEEEVLVYSQKIPNLSKPKQGLIAGDTKVDAYIVSNAEVKDYISEREAVYQRFATILKDLGYMASRDFMGSEDGEVVLCQKKKEEPAHILTLLNPEFVDFTKEMSDDDLKKWTKSLIKEINQTK